MFRSFNWRLLGLALLLAVITVSCKSDNSTSNTVTSRTINVRLRADQTVTYRASFLLDGVLVVPSMSSVLSGTESVVNVSLDATALPRGTHTVSAVILAEVPIPSLYRMTASVTENGNVVVPEVPDAFDALGINGRLDLSITY